MFEESAISDGFECKMYMIKTETLGTLIISYEAVRYKLSIVKFNERVDIVFAQSLLGSVK